jgi:transposase
LDESLSSYVTQGYIVGHRLDPTGQKGGLFMTVYVGIDIAKELHFAAIMDHDGVLSNPFAFENNAQGFQTLLSACSSYDKEELLFGFESTAHYQDNLAFFLGNLGLKFILINPLQVSALRKSSIRNTKTDRADAHLICMAMYHFHHHATSRDSDSTIELNQLCKTRHALMSKRTRAKIQLVSHMDRIFPELARFFKGNLHIITAYKLIETHPLPSQIKKTRIDVLTKLLCDASHGKYSRDKAQELKSLACVSVGIPSEIFAFQAQLLVHQIEFYSRQIQAVEDKITSFESLHESLICTIPGINTIFAAYILSSIPNITHFDNSCKLVAYAGLDPIVRQSGKFTASSTRMSKRGNALLRYALIWTSWNVVRNNKTFRAYYDRKRVEGKSHYNALGHCATKLLRCIYHMLTHHIAFNLE